MNIKEFFSKPDSFSLRSYISSSKKSDERKLFKNSIKKTPAPNTVAPKQKEKVGLNQVDLNKEAGKQTSEMHPRHVVLIKNLMLALVLFHGKVLAICKNVRNYFVKGILS